MIRSIRSEKGALLAVTLIALIVLSVMGFAFLSRSNTDVRASGETAKKTGAAYAAESALNKIALRLKGVIERSENIHILSTPIDSSTNSEVDPGMIVEVAPASYEYWDYVYNQCIPLQNSAFPFDTKEWICQRQAANYEIQQQLVDPDSEFDLSLVEDSSNAFINTSEDAAEAWQQYTTANRVEALNEPLLANKMAQKRIYRFVVNATKRGARTAAETLESTIVAWAVPFQGIAFSDYVLSFAPGEPYDVNGWLHSNRGVRAGGSGPDSFIPSYPNDFDVTINDEDFDNGDMAITSSGKIWHFFGVEMPGFYKYSPSSVKIYYGPSNYKTFSGEIVEKDGKDEDYFKSHLDECQETPNTSSGCWKDVFNEDFTLYSMAVNADSPKFRNKIADSLPELHPGWHTTMINAGKDPSEILQPGDPSTDDPINKKYKVFYRSDLRIVKTNNDDTTCVFASLDGEGNEITDPTDPRHISNFYDSSNPAGSIIRCRPKDFFDPRKGRNVNTIELDIGNLKAAGTNFKTIYLGSLYGPTGELKFPKPDSNTGFIDAVMLANASSLPDDGLTVSSPNSVYFRGDFNLPPDSSQEPSNTNRPPPAAVLADSVTFLSNDWITGTEHPDGWYIGKNDINGDPIGVKGWNPIQTNWMSTPPVTTEKTKYIVSYMAGNANPTAFEHPLIENWGSGSKELIRYMSAVNLWKPREFPPPLWDSSMGDYLRDSDGNIVRNTGWHNDALGYYSPAKWTNKQILTFGQFPIFWATFIHFSKPSIKPVENPFL